MPAGVVTQATHSGGVGAPPGGHYEPPARSWLTARVRNSPPRKRGPTTEKHRQWSAARRASFTKGASRLASAATVAPRGAPLPSQRMSDVSDLRPPGRRRGEERTTGAPRAGQTTGAAERWLHQAVCKTAASLRRRDLGVGLVGALQAHRRPCRCRLHLLDEALQIGRARGRPCGVPIAWRISMKRPGSTRTCGSLAA